MEFASSLRPSHFSLTEAVIQKRIEANGRLDTADYLLICPLCRMTDLIIQVLWGVGAFISGLLVTPCINFPLRCAGLVSPLEEMGWEGAGKAFADGVIHALGLLKIFGYLFPAEGLFEETPVEEEMVFQEESVELQDLLEYVLQEIDAQNTKEFPPEILNRIYHLYLKGGGAAISPDPSPEKETPDLVSPFPAFPDKPAPSGRRLSLISPVKLSEVLPKDYHNTLRISMLDQIRTPQSLRKIPGQHSPRTLTLVTFKQNEEEYDPDNPFSALKKRRISIVGKSPNEGTKGAALKKQLFPDNDDEWSD